MRDAVIKISKTGFAFEGSCVIDRGFRGREHCDFQVTPDKVFLLENHPEESERIHVQVALRNKAGDKEEKRDYYFYNVGAEGTGDSRVGGPGESIECNGCDHSMDVLFDLLTRFRDRNWSSAAPDVAQSATPVSLQRGLSSQYPTGTALNLRTGLVGSIGCVQPTSTFKVKEKKLHAPSLADNLSTNGCAKQPIVPGTEVNLDDIKVFQKENRVALVVFQGQCAVPDCSQHYEGAVVAQVDFEFPKGFLATAQLAQVQQEIGHVFSRSSPDAPAQEVDVAQPVKEAVSVAPLKLPATYVNAQASADRLQLNADQSFSLQESGHPYRGIFVAIGDKIELNISETGSKTTLTRQGANLVDSSTQTWSLTEQSSQALESQPVRIVGQYVTIQQPGNRLQLNPDGTFFLVQRGRSYSGMFTIEGNNVTFRGGARGTGIMQGDTLIDDEGLKWVKQATASDIGSATIAPLLKNADIVKLVKVGIDDATIIKKIKSSRCKFDTSTDALVLLKKSGVKAAVLNAMVGAGE
jgi:hypothetical protein